MKRATPNMSDADPRNLQRFVEAQSPVYEQVLRELRDGEKRTHWMWFTFPEVDGLRQSPMAHKYGIQSKAEARNSQRIHRKETSP